MGSLGPRTRLAAGLRPPGRTRADCADDARVDGRERVLARVRGRFGTTEVVEGTWDDGRPVRLLTVDGTLQSATYVDEGWCDPVFDYYVLFDLAFEACPRAHDLLMLGGGGLGYPKYLLAEHPEVALDVVEADPAVIRLARRHFFLGRLLRERRRAHLPGPRVVCTDALDFLEGTGRTYDAILCDCFAAGEAPSELAGPKAARLYLERLAPQGAFLANVVSAAEGPRARPLRELAATLAAAGFSRVFAAGVQPGREAEEDNVMLLATRAALDLPWARRLA
ncbi:spermidine synthase [Atopobiaceae bacterium HCP3S3_F7]